MAVLRRQNKNTPKNIALGNLKFDEENRVFYLDEKPLDLTSKEYNLLALFIKRPGKVFTKQEIYEFLWDEPYYNDDNTIMVHISKLRDKIEKKTPLNLCFLLFSSLF